MTTLVRPDERWCAAWVEMVQEFEPGLLHGSGLPGGVAADPTPAACREMVAWLLAQEDPATPMPEGRVHCTYRWIVDGEDLVGFVAIRHRLNDFLLEEGGHIGYSVRPSRRREGHASRALALALDEARRLGLGRVLVTCDDDNLASARTIETNGGVLEDVRRAKRRYWIGLGGE